MPRVVTFKADEELVERLDALARLRSVSRSEVIRRALEHYLAKESRCRVRRIRLNR